MAGGISFVNIRETGGWSEEGEAGGTEDGGAARHGGCARTGAGTNRQLIGRW